MDDDVNPAEFLANGVGDGYATFSGADIRRRKQSGIADIYGLSTGGGEDLRSSFVQPRHHRLANPLGTARYQNTLALKFAGISGECKFACHQVPPIMRIGRFKSGCELKIKRK